jgi:transmembrane sensor
MSDQSPRFQPASVPPSDDRMAHFLAGAVSPEEGATVQEYLEGHPVEARLLIRLRTLEFAAPEPEPARIDHAWELMYDRMHAEHSALPAKATRGAHRPMWGDARMRRTRMSGIRMSGMRAIAAAAALALIGIVAYSSNHSASSPQRFQTAAGERSTIRLSDGSSVMLAPSTTAIISDDMVEIVGEAYFQVTTHSSRPFTVRTANASVHVLGTAFDVRHYPDDRHTSVVVEDGKVTVRSRRSGERVTPTIVTPNMMALIMDSGVTVTSGAPVRQHTGWTRGILIFDRMSLRDVAAELSRSYGSSIRVGDSALATKTLVAEVDVRQMSLVQTLDIITATLGARYVRDARDSAGYVLMPGASHRMAPPEHHRIRFPQPETRYGR